MKKEQYILLRVPFMKAMDDVGLGLVVETYLRRRNRLDKGGMEGFGVGIGLHLLLNRHLILEESFRNMNDDLNS